MARQIVRLQIVRHGEAVMLHPDSERPLSDAGIRSIRRLQEQVACDLPDLVVSSPLTRARQTAEILIGSDQYVVWNEVIPAGEAKIVFDKIVAEDVTGVCIVSHQPLVSRLIKYLTNETGFIETGMMVQLEVDVENVTGKVLRTIA